MNPTIRTAASATVVALTLIASAALAQNGQVIIIDQRDGDGPEGGQTRVFRAEGGSGGMARSFSFAGNGMGGFGMPQLLAPDFSKRDVAIIAPALGLASEQQYVVELLLEQYASDFEAAAQPLREALKRSSAVPQIAQFFGPDGPGEPMSAILPAIHEVAGLTGAGGDVDFIALGDGQVFVQASGSPHGAPAGPGGPGLAPGEELPEGASFTTHVEVRVQADGPDLPPELQQKIAEMHANAQASTMQIPEEVRKQIEESIRQRIEERLASHRKELEELKALGGIKGDKEPANAEQPQEPPPTPEQIRDMANAFSSHKSNLYGLFIGDLKSSLNDEQLAGLDDVERQLRRVHALPRSRFSGEGVDLARVLAQSVEPANQSPKTQEAVAQYEVVLDGALINRDRTMTRTEIEQSMARAKGDADQQVRLDEQQAAARLQVRTVNDQSIDLIAATLGPDLAAEFRADVRQASFQRIFRPTITQRSFKAAGTIEELDGAVKESIAAMEQSYLAELAAMNERLVQLTREFEPREETFRADMVKRMQEAMQNGAPPPPLGAENPVMEQFQKRSELGRSYLTKLRSLLTPEQFAGLPGAKSALDLAASGPFQRGVIKQ